MNGILPISHNEIGGVSHWVILFSSLVVLSTHRRKDWWWYSDNSLDPSFELPCELPHLTPGAVGGVCVGSLGWMARWWRPLTKYL